jgi:transcriptional regulator with XRE-family HTH domain
MRSSKIYRAAREYLGLSRKDVCAILGWEMEDLIAIEEGYIPSLDMQGQLYRLYVLNGKEWVYLEAYNIEGLNEHDKREVVKMFLFAEEYRDRKAKVDR